MKQEHLIIFGSLAIILSCSWIFSESISKFFRTILGLRFKTEGEFIGMICPSKDFCTARCPAQYLLIIKNKMGEDETLLISKELFRIIKGKNSKLEGTLYLFITCQYANKEIEIEKCRIEEIK